MSQESQVGSLAWAATLLVEEACNHYEKAWRSGRRPNIEDFVAGRALAERSLLLHELVSLEIEYCRSCSEECTAAEYLARFPMLDSDWLASIMSNRPEGPASQRGATTFSGKNLESVQGICPSDRAERLPTIAEQAAHILVSALANDVETPDRYTLTRLHATGGIGRVWLARDQRLGREIALKELRPENANNPAIWDRFLLEARITGQLEHPGIVPIYELGGQRSEGPPFYTMRFVKGRTFTEVIRDYHHKRAADQVDVLDLHKVLGAFVSACQAVAYAHARGVIHRDLKGQNIVLGDFGEVMVLDWGMAKMVGAKGQSPAMAEETPSVTPETKPLAEVPAADNPTLEGQVLGTPANMAPEQAAGQIDRIDSRTDVYGLGSILYEILTGQPPFTGPDTREIMRRVREEKVIRPRQLWVATPVAVEAICLKALAKNPDDRYASVRRLTQDLECWLAGEPTSAYREPWTARTARWTKRHRTFVMAATVALVVAATTFAIATVMLVAANQREREARQDAVQFASDAARQRDRARDAVDAFYTQVSESPEMRAKGVERLRTQLLESALKFYRQMLEEKREDTRVEREQARTYYRLGLLYRAMDRNALAQQAYEDAIASFRGFVAAHPDAESDPNELATYRFQLAKLLESIGRDDRAQGGMRRGGAFVPWTGGAVSRQRELSKQRSGGSVHVGRASTEIGRYQECRSGIPLGCAPLREDCRSRTE